MRIECDNGREQRARALAESGAVTRRGDLFVVRASGPGAANAEFLVRRDNGGAITCGCDEARRNRAADFRCEHMLAVRLAIRSRRSEALASRSGNVLEFSSARHARSVQNSGMEADREIATDRLDRRDPNWTHSVRHLRQIGNFFAVTVSVTAGGATREGIGTGIVADPRGIESAERLALRNAIAKFENCDQDPSTRPDFPAEPVAHSLFDLVTAKQLGIIRSLARDGGIDADRECERMLHCTVGELSKTAAARLIEHVASLRKEAGVDSMRLAG